MSSRAASGRIGREKPQRRSTVVRNRDLGAERSQQRPEAIGGVLVVVDDQHRQPGQTLFRDRFRLRAHSATRFASATGNRTMNSLPLPTPSLFASTLPPCISTRFRTSVSPIPSPPCARRSGRVRPARTSRRRAAASRAAMPMPVSRTVTTRSAPRARAESQIAPPVVGVLGGVVQQVREYLAEPHRVGLEQHGSRGIATISS